jgi:hypothetical protein
MPTFPCQNIITPRVPINAKAKWLEVKKTANSIE